MIFLTSKDEEIDELFGLKIGADDFIRKPFSQRLLIERVKAVLRRWTPKDRDASKEANAKAIERGQLRMDPERHSCTWKNVPVTLTVTEFLILQALASRPGIVKSRNALMDVAYDDQVYVDDRTIDSHIKRLRRRFKISDGGFDMIETLYGVGYRFRESDAKTYDLSGGSDYPTRESESDHRCLQATPSPLHDPVLTPPAGLAARGRSIPRSALD